jgi:hypothetical protein
VPTVKGLITTRWEKDTGGRFSLYAVVPANTRATIYLPKVSKGGYTVTESVRRLWPANPELSIPGVLAVQEEDLTIKCVVGAGEYHFLARPTRVPASK